MPRGWGSVLVLLVWGCLLCRVVWSRFRFRGLVPVAVFWVRSRSGSAPVLPVLVGCGGCGRLVVGGGRVGVRLRRRLTLVPVSGCRCRRCVGCGGGSVPRVASCCCRCGFGVGFVALLCPVVLAVPVAGRGVVGVGCRWCGGCARGRPACGRCRCRRSCGGRCRLGPVCGLSCRCRCRSVRWLAADSALPAVGGVVPCRRFWRIHKPLECVAGSAALRRHLPATLGKQSDERSAIVDVRTSPTSQVGFVRIDENRVDTSLRLSTTCSFGYVLLPTGRVPAIPQATSQSRRRRRRRLLVIAQVNLMLLHCSPSVANAQRNVV